MSASLGGSYHDSTDAASFATCHTAVSMLSRQHSFGMESSSIRARQTRLFSSPTPAPSNEGTSSSTHQRKTPPTTPVTEVVGTRLSQAVQHETLTADEAQSISGVLFNPNFDPVFSLETTTPEDVTKVMNIAIESYAAQKLRRAESGRDAIGNVGFYVRSIVKKELEALNVSPQSGKKRLSSNAGVENEEQQNANTSTATTEPITELLRFHNIQPNELNDNCMHALNQYSISTVKYALEAFSRQQRRREMNGTEKIANPSSYIMAVLRYVNNTLSFVLFDQNNTHQLIALLTFVNRNSPEEPASNGTSEQKQGSDNTHSATSNSIPMSSQPVARKNAQNSVEESIDSLIDIAPDITEEEVIISTPESTQPTSPREAYVKTKTTATSGNLAVSSERSIAKRVDTDDDNFKTVPPINPDDKVSMEYVDKCLACLYNLERPIKSLSGVGDKTEECFHKLGIFTIRDLLWHFPRSFIDRSVLQNDVTKVDDGELGTFRLVVHSERKRGNTVSCTDEAGNNVDVSFFYGRNNKGNILAKAAMNNICNKDVEAMIVSGKVKHSETGAVIFNPDVIVPCGETDDVLGIEPVYRLSAGISKNKLTSVIDSALEVAQGLRMLPESLPNDVLKELSWPCFVDALSLVHKPTSMDESGVNSPARQRLAFEELCMQQAQLALTRWNLKYDGISAGSQRNAASYSSWRDSPLVSDAVSSLPFELTASQVECLSEMFGDAIGRDNGKLLRLLQGDVGSGKTVLAYLLGLGCIESRQGGGRVVAILAPTQLLALQHYQTISDFASSFELRSTDSLVKKISVELLTGNVVGSKREELLSRLEQKSEDEAVFLIGTHALVTADTIERLRELPSVSSSQSKGLALSVIDEEQRFGVKQRQVLASCAAHALYISATPIPRTFGLKGFGGLMDTTHLEASEPRFIETTIASSDDLDKAVMVLKHKINSGSKAFWVLPRIGISADDYADEEENTQQSNVLSRYKLLADELGANRVGLVHGRMSIKEREEQLAQFADPASSVDVLVGTTVIEGEHIV